MSKVVNPNNLFLANFKKVETLEVIFKDSEKKCSLPNFKLKLGKLAVGPRGNNEWNSVQTSKDSVFMGKMSSQ